jgi:hypothetical protein
MPKSVTCYSEGVKLAGDLLLPADIKRGERRAGEPKKLVVLKGFGHYEIYGGDAFRQVMEETLAWYGRHLPAR